ncbi:MAG: glucosaminidase domain-containing protein [Clostridiales bacterium]|jgi:hypothetical protein|nr:glucosaminidase domain-containing protein [Clostridiales bacterium]
MQRIIFSSVVAIIAIVGLIVIANYSGATTAFNSGAGGISVVGGASGANFNSVAQDKTPIKGDAQYSLASAKQWAVARGATDRFIAAADIYWEIGKMMGLRPDVMYAQAAKETAFGNYTGNVREDMNNFAGIKTATAAGDKTSDHETFASVRDGIMAHYNHMGAYVGVAPVGEVHERYYSVMTTAWAGSIRYVEELGGKWAPAEDYGISVVRDYLMTMDEAK